VTAPAGTLRAEIARSEPDARRRFDLDRHGLRVVLDVVAAAAREDPTLFFRYSCRSGYCGTCTLLVNGRPVLACQAPVPGAALVRIAPLGGFPVVRDLVVDPAPFAHRWAAAEARLDPVEVVGDTGPRPIDPAGRRVIDPSLDCISCGACFAACDLSAADRPFLGPAALNRAAVVVADRRDTRRAERLATVDGHDGIEGCHGIGACSLVCPKGLDPARSIRRLRRWRITGLP
jgi:succinate dehydrogenase / fumarate reductase iron-sulfur subunit/fumarate reductase iron-sulfur subunit